MLHWFGHVKRMDSTRILRKVLEFKSEEKKSPCGDPEEGGSARYRKSSKKRKKLS
jgi:hypothetical protein